MIKPIRIQRSRQSKQISPNGLPIVYVGRPSKYGNPFTHDIANKSRVELFRSHINSRPNLLIEIKSELRGKNLACWCKLGKPCHADILLEIANY